jgi:hypothetical protein
MAAQYTMPHHGHEGHLCFLENIGYLEAQELLEMGVDRMEEYKRLVRDAAFVCKKCGRAAAKSENLCQPAGL